MIDKYYTAESKFTSNKEEKSNLERDYYIKYILNETSKDKSTIFLIKWKGIRVIQ